MKNRPSEWKATVRITLASGEEHRIMAQFLQQMQNRPEVRRAIKDNDIIGLDMLNDEDLDR